jgi:hypothetical protein
MKGIYTFTVLQAATKDRDCQAGYSVPSREQSEWMGRKSVSWTTKDKAGISGWSILIYDSLRSAILRG